LYLGYVHSDLLTLTAS